jgi:hypothetical protein
MMVGHPFSIRDLYEGRKRGMKTLNYFTPLSKNFIDTSMRHGSY